MGSKFWFIRKIIYKTVFKLPISFFKFSSLAEVCRSRRWQNKNWNCKIFNKNWLILYNKFKPVDINIEDFNKKYLFLISSCRNYTENLI